MKAVPALEITQARELAAVRAFYERAGYGGGAADADLTFAAKVGDRLVGVVRLCEEDGIIVLRGMHIDPACQRQGIGRALLMHCAPHLDAGAAYCLPYAHLAGFYGQAGFVPVEPEAIPVFLRKRLAAYLASGQQVLAMHRASPGLAADRISQCLVRL